MRDTRDRVVASSGPMIARCKRVSRWVAVGAVLVGLGAIAGVVLPPDDAAAQRTGGSFGGGSFGGGGGGRSFGGGGGSFGGGGGHFGGGGYHHYGSGSGGSIGGAGMCFLVVFALMFVFLVKGRTAGAPRYTTDYEAYVPPEARRIDVSALMIGLDAEARPFVQKRLDELAQSGDTSSGGGLHALLHETITMLRRAELAWTYVGVLSTRPLAPEQAEALFRKTATDLRSRFKDELVRRGDGRLATQDTPEMRAREHEGRGLVVVSVVVAAHCEIPDVTVATDRSQVSDLVRSIGAISPADLAALEVIWSPAAENDRMSSAELEAVYPDLRRLPGADSVGRVFCAYCSGPFARELLRCPHCGAPSAEASRA